MRVQVPKPGDDHPHFGRVAAITIACFAIGVAWPRLAGIKLVPNAPIESPEGAGSADDTTTAPPGSASAEPEAPPAAKGTPAPADSAAEAPPEPSDRVKISDPKVVSCRDAKGNKKTSCGDLALDDAVRPKLLALAACPAAKNVQGALSLGLELDFDSGKVGEMQRGKSTNLPDATADAVIECAKKEFSTIALGDVKHEHPKYTVFYLVDFLAPGEKAQAAESGASVTPASGHATVTWEVAIIRDKPKDGEIVARIMRGTRINVSGREGDWYRIKYDAKGSEGWVFRTAIGM